MATDIRTTNSSAIHNINYYGPLNIWPAKRDRHECTGRRLCLTDTYPEHWTGYGEGGVVRSQMIDVKFGDFKSTLYHKGYRKVPDILIVAF